MIIWLASYPRSGNTYLRSILNHFFGKHSYSVYGDVRDIGANAALKALVGHEDGDRGSMDFEAFRSSAEAYFIKTHDLPNEIISNDDTVFYVVRDGRDASLSYLKYLHEIVGATALSLADVLAGGVPFGFWGNHVIHWHQARFDKLHNFKFEDITVDPEALADRLADILAEKRSREPFPDLKKFREAAPSFFGAGKAGVHQERFSGTDRALFELFSGPAMRLAGYEEGGLGPDELAAYAGYCQRWKQLTSESNRLKPKIVTLKSQVSELRRDLKSSTQERAKLETQLALVTERYEKLMRYTGLAAVRWISQSFR